MSSNAPNKYERIVVLVDMDCFYCQVEEKLNPDLRGKPIAVVQYNAWKGGGIIAVNYPARSRGVTRHMRGDEAAEHCPDIVLVRVPNVREKADLSKYRDAGKQVASVLQTFSPLLERASVDEAYLDITQNVQERLKDMDKGTFTVMPEMLASTYALGYENIGKFVQTVAARMKQGPAGAVHDLNDPNNNDIKLLIAATIVTDIRRAVKEQTEYECSAGIAHNKILGKLVCGINKPNKQTLLPITHVDHLYRTLSVKKIQGLGGKFGETVCDSLKITNMIELGQFSLEELQRRFDDKNSLWLHNIARGIDLAPVTPKFSSKSIGCCKKFPGRNSIKGIATLQHWLSELADEMFDRIAQDEVENNRRPRHMTVSFMQELNRSEVNSTRSVPLSLVDAAQMAADALDVIRRNTAQFFKTGQSSVLNDPILFLGLCVGKFEDIEQANGGGRNTIMSMFSNKAKQNENKVHHVKDQVNLREDTIGECEETGVELNSNVTQGPSKTDKLPSIFSSQRKPLSPKVPTSEPSPESAIFLDDTLEDKPEISCSDEKTNDQVLQMPSDRVSSSTIETQKSFFGIKPKCASKLTVDVCKIKSNSDIKCKASTPESSNASIVLENSENPKSSFFGIIPKPPVSSLQQNFTNEEKPNLGPDNLQKPKKSFFGIKPKQLSGSDKEIPNLQKTSETPSTSTAQPTPDYKTTYAEFHQPVIPTVSHISPPTERCSHCDRKVFCHEMQSHTDAHFAFQLSQEQRLEFRQSQTQSIVRQPSAKKPKLNHSTRSSKAPGPSLLTKFLLRAADSSSTENANSVENPILTEKCTECGRTIRVDQLLEHADYHTAKRLQMELNKPRIVDSSQSGSRMSASSVLKPGSVAAFFKREA